jgi:hypothetical protein
MVFLADNIKAKGFAAERKGEREEMQDRHVIIDNFLSLLKDVSTEMFDNIRICTDKNANILNVFSCFNIEKECPTGRFSMAIQEYAHPNFVPNECISSWLKGFQKVL